MRFVDANVFVYVLVKSPKRDFEIAKGILERIEKGEKTATSLAIIHEVVDWLEYNNLKKEVRTFLIGVNSYLSLEKMNIEWDDFLAALDDVDEYRIDFVDAVVLQRMKKNKITEIYSNDKDFDRVEWVMRLWE